MRWQVMTALVAAGLLLAARGSVRAADNGYFGSTGSFYGTTGSFYGGVSGLGSLPSPYPFYRDPLGSTLRPPGYGSFGHFFNRGYFYETQPSLSYPNYRYRSDLARPGRWPFHESLPHYGMRGYW